MSDISVVVFEDNIPRKDLLKLLLDNSNGFSCLGIFEDCRDVIDIIATNKPDIVLMDINMPFVDGIEGLKLIKAEFPNQKVVIQTIFEDDEKIFDAIKAGADGYVLKKTHPEKFLDAISEIHNGGIVMTPVIARKVISFFNDKKVSNDEFGLTIREKNIMSLLVDGYSYKMIADSCEISYATVNTHLKNIYKKLQVTTGKEAVAKAVKLNLNYTMSIRKK
jgi:DNA-binding NarL/FixJ family response regulator